MEPIIQHLIFSHFLQLFLPALSLSLSCSLYIMTNSLTSDLLCYDPAGSGIIREEKKKEGGGGGGGGERGREEEEEESGGEMRLVDKSVLTWQ